MTERPLLGAMVIYSYRLQTWPRRFQRRDTHLFCCLWWLKSQVMNNSLMGNRGTFMFSSKKTAFVMSRWSVTPLRWSCRRHSVWYEGENVTTWCQSFEIDKRECDSWTSSFLTVFFSRYSLHFIMTLSIL